MTEQHRYLFKFYYIGKKRFYGSQRQKDLPTIEGYIIEKLLKKKYIKNIENSGIEFASRTDKFVSALGATFSFLTNKKPILIEINTELPKEIGLWAFTRVPNDFSSRYHALLRHYKYIVPEILSHLQKHFKIDLNIMNKACHELEGEHDFVNFCKREKESIRTVRSMDCVKMSIINDFLIFDFKSKAYLRQQIRRMVKKILELGKGEIEYTDFLSLFDSSKLVSYQPADPKGLILWNIEYGKNISYEIDLKSKKRMENYFFSQKNKFRFKNQLFSIMQQNNSSQ